VTRESFMQSIKPPEEMPFWAKWLALKFFAKGVLFVTLLGVLWKLAHI